MAKHYEPPKQSTAGQIIDVILLLIFVFAVLWVPAELGLTGAQTVTVPPEGVTVTENADGTRTWTGLSWEALGQNETMQAQWAKLGKSMEDAAGYITTRFDYSINWLAFFITAAVVVGYFVFLLIYSDKEYREVIAEKFGDKR